MLHLCTCINMTCPACSLFVQVFRVEYFNTYESQQGHSSGTYTLAVTNISIIGLKTHWPIEKSCHILKNLANYPGIVKSWTLEEKLQLPLF